MDAESPLAESLDGDERYNWLMAKARRARKEGGEPLTAEEEDDAQKLVEARIKANEEEYQRLSKLLAEFYGSSAEDGREHPGRPEIKKGPWNQSRLEPEGVRLPAGSQGHVGKPADEADPRSGATKFKALALYKGEMEQFTKFLKERFFRG